MDALITEAKNGDKEAFVRLIRMNKQSLYKTAWIYLRDEQDIADALHLCLDEESRKIVELYYFDEFSVKEISALLEMNSNTVSTKLSRARAKLKKVIRR